MTIDIRNNQRHTNQLLELHVETLRDLSPRDEDKVLDDLEAVRTTAPSCRRPSASSAPPSVARRSDPRRPQQAVHRARRAKRPRLLAFKPWFIPTRRSGPYLRPARQTHLTQGVSMSSLAMLPDVSDLVASIANRLSDDEVAAAQANAGRFRETAAAVPGFRMFAEEPANR